MRSSRAGRIAKRVCRSTKTTSSVAVTIGHGRNLAGCGTSTNGSDRARGSLSGGFNFGF
jgi:hypothetical protein